MNMIETLTTIASFVQDIPQPGPPTAPPGSEKFLEILSWAKWVALGIAILGLIILGAKMTMSHQRGSGEGHLGTFGWVVAGLVLISAAVSIVGFFAG